MQLARKLSVRLVKALLQGSRNGKIPREVIGRRALQSAIDVLERAVADDPNAVKLWGSWGAIVNEKPEDASRAKQTLLELPIWHQQPYVFPAKPPLPLLYPPGARGRTSAHSLLVAFRGGN